MLHAVTVLVQVTGEATAVAVFMLAWRGSGGTVGGVEVRAVSAPAGDVTAPIDSDIAGWVARKRARGHRDWKRAEASLRRIVAECRWASLHDANPAGFAAWLDSQRSAGVTGRTLNKHQSTVSSFIKYVRAVRPEACPINWAKGLERSMEDDAGDGSRFMLRDEFDRLIAWCDQNAPHRADYYRFLAFTGMRRSDERLVTRQTIRLDGVPRIELPRRTKGRRCRVVPIHADLLPIVKARLVGHPGDTMFDERPNLKTLKRDCERAGVDPDGVGFHSFRKLCGSMLAAAGVPLRVAQEVLGHSTPVLTARVYQAVEHSQTAAEVAKIPTSGGERVWITGVKARSHGKRVDKDGDSSDDGGAESSGNVSHTHHHRDSTGDPFPGHCSIQHRPSAVEGSPVDPCEPGSRQDSAGSPKARAFVKRRSGVRFPEVALSKGGAKAQAIADILDGLARLLREEAADGNTDPERP